jgi:hypothetical protein
MFKIPITTLHQLLCTSFFERLNNANIRNVSISIYLGATFPASFIPHTFYSRLYQEIKSVNKYSSWINAFPFPQM